MVEEPTRLDDLPRIRAAADPGGVALRTDTGDSLTFAELADRVGRCATRIRERAGGPGEVVAIVSPLSPAFAVAYFGALRAGNTVVCVNPFLREEGLAHLVSASGARLVITTAEVAGRLDAGVETLSLGPGLWDAPELTDVPAVKPDEVACIHFTSGTTGAPKGVRQTHRNLLANAEQIAYAHALGARSVTVNHLPTFHPMHLNAGLFSGATQVLCTDPDPAASIRTANEARATTYYSLPVRLSLLAADPRLPQLRFDTVRAVFSGGSALPVSAAGALGEHFRIPILQGYGLAETAPMTHCGRPDRPKPGSCGPRVPGTDCRIVGLESGEPVAAGERGEIQVRGPQLMLGYLGDPDGGALDPEGWFATGDVGYLDDEEYLFVVDRLKDVFKCDNWLVSPQETERVLLRHPGLADGVVVDYPDQHSGAVAGALVVPEPLPETGGQPDQAALDAIAAQVNEGLPYYQHIRHIRAVGEIPRFAGGKVRRRALRQVLSDLVDSTDTPRDPATTAG